MIKSSLIASVELLQVTHEFLLLLVDFQLCDHLGKLLDLIVRGLLCLSGSGSGCLIGTRHLIVFDFFDGAALVLVVCSGALAHLLVHLLLLLVNLASIFMFLLQLLCIDLFELRWRIIFTILSRILPILIRSRRTLFDLFVFGRACRPLSRRFLGVSKLLFRPSLLDHVLESDTVALISIRLLLLDDGALLTLLLETTTREGLRIPAVVSKDWPVVEVLEIREPGDHRLAILLDLVDARIILQVEYLQVGHIHQNLIKDRWVVNLVVLEVEGRDAWAVKKAAEVIETVPSNPVPRQVEHVEALEVLKALDRDDHVVAQVKVGKHPLVLEALDPLNAVLMDVEAAKLGVLLEAEQTVATVALEVEHLELGEELHALNLVETYDSENRELVEEISRRK